MIPSHVPTERQMQAAIYRRVASEGGLAIPNFTPPGWWECDVWSVGADLRVAEYEVKRTIAGFGAERTKVGPVGFGPNGHSMSKWRCLRDGCGPGPSFFYYVVPVDIAEQVESRLPEFAGLIAYSGRRLYDRRRAPMLHDRKMTADELHRAVASVCMRRCRDALWRDMDDRRAE